MDEQERETPAVVLPTAGALHFLQKSVRCHGHYHQCGCDTAGHDGGGIPNQAPESVSSSFTAFHYKYPRSCR